MSERLYYIELEEREQIQLEQIKNIMNFETDQALIRFAINRLHSELISVGS